MGKPPLFGRTLGVRNPRMRIFGAIDVPSEFPDVERWKYEAFE
jgi:hypothetical protein